MITERSPVVLFMFFRGSDTLCPICIGQYASSGTGFGIGEEKDVIISSCVLGVLVSVLLGFSGFAFSFLAL